MTSSRTPAPAVSVIIPTHNASRFIRRALECALSSTGVTFEVLVVDDASTDDTCAILDSFGEQIRWFAQPRGGPYKARNLGARQARGEWLAFLDADDEWDPTKLAKQIALADARTGLVYTDRFNIGDTERVGARQSDGVRLHEGDVFEPLLLQNFITLSSVMVRRSWFEELGGFAEDQAGVQDWDLWLRFSAAGGSVKLLREPVTSYRYHDEQMSLDHDKRAANRVAVVRRALRTRRGQSISRPMARQALANVWEIGAWQAAPNHSGKAIAWYARAAWHWPWNIRLYKGIAKVCLAPIGVRP